MGTRQDLLIVGIEGQGACTPENFLWPHTPMCFMRKRRAHGFFGCAPHVDNKRGGSPFWMDSTWMKFELFQLPSDRALRHSHCYHFLAPPFIHVLVTKIWWDQVLWRGDQIRVHVNQAKQLLDDQVLRVGTGVYLRTPVPRVSKFHLSIPKGCRHLPSPCPHLS